MLNNFKLLVEKIKSFFSSPKVTVKSSEAILGLI